MHNRNIIVAFILSLFVTLSGCSTLGQGTADHAQNSAGSEQDTIDEIKNAKTALDLKQYVSISSRALIYSEYSGEANDFAIYFSLLDVDSYVVVDIGDEKYVLFEYVYSEYDQILASINNIKKTYDKQDHRILNVNVDYEINNIECEGCFPNTSMAYCILKLEEDIDELLVDACPYSKYDGGLIYINKWYGVVNDTYDIIVPIQYDIIRDLETFGDNPKKYFFIRTDDGAGLMDENYNVMIPPSYENIEYLSENQFIVQKSANKSHKGSEDDQLYIIDENENVLYGPVDGCLAYQNKIDNPIHQIIICRVQDHEIYEGVVDDHLNIIVDPIYIDVSDFGIHNDMDYFYVVEKENGETAVIDSSGKQQTEFKKADIYETQTAYYDQIGYH